MKSKPDPPVFRQPGRYSLQKELLLEQEKELRSQLAVLTDELKRTNQQMQVILEKWNLAQASRFGRSSEKMKYDTDTYQQLELAVMYAECFNEAGSHSEWGTTG